MLISTIGQTNFWRDFLDSERRHSSLWYTKPATS